MPAGMGSVQFGLRRCLIAVAFAAGLIGLLLLGRTVVLSPGPRPQPRAPEEARAPLAALKVSSDAPRDEPPSPREASKQDFFGTVVASDDETPIEGATVALKPLIRGAEYAQEIPTQSDAKGRFGFQELEPGAYLVRAEHPDFIPTADLGQIEIKEGKQLPEENLILERGLWAKGRVADAATGEPIAGAHIEFQFLAPDRKQGERNPVHHKSGTTGAGGLFTVRGLRQGDHEVRCHAEGYLTSPWERVSIAPPGLDGIALELELGGIISGRVLDREGKPISKAKIGAKGNDGEGFWISNQAESDGGGKFKIVGLDLFTYQVKGSHKDYAPVVIRDLKVAPRQETAALEIRLTEGGSIRGTIGDEDGKPIAGATVVTQGGWPIEHSSKTQSGEGGGYEIKLLPPGSHHIQVSADSRKGTSRNVQVEEGKTSSGVNFVLGPEFAVTLTGRVIDSSGRPVEGAKLQLEPGWKSEPDRRGLLAETDHDGRFGLTKGTTEGDWLHTLWAMKPGFESGCHRVELPTGEVNITLQRSATIAGTIRAKGRESFQKLKVIAVEQWSPKTWRRPLEKREAGSVDPKGDFEVLVGEGIYRIQCVAKGFAPALSGPVELRPGERRDGIVIDLLPEAEIEGRVLTKGSGKPIWGARVSFQTQSAQADEPPSTETGADGSFRLSGLPEGPFELTVIDDRPPMKKIVTGLSIKAGERKDLEVEINRTGGIRGRVRINREMVSEVTVSIEEPISPDPDGRFEFGGLAAGEYLVSVHVAAKGPPWPVSRKTVTVLENQYSEMEFDLTSVVLLHGRVTSRGSLVMDYRVRVRALRGGASNYRVSADRSGGYSILLSGAGPYSLWVYGLERNDDATIELIVPEGVSEFSFPIELPAGGISGVVVDAEDGKPIWGATVVAIGSRAARRELEIQHGRPQSGWRSGKTSEWRDGRFSFSHLPAGTYDVLVHEEGYAEASVAGIEVVEGRILDGLRVPLEREIAFWATVVDGGGLPIEGAIGVVRNSDGKLLQISRRLVGSDEFGMLEMFGLGKGIYSLTLLHSSFASLRTQMEASPDVPTATFRLTPGGHVRFRVVDRNDQPVGDARIEVIDSRKLDVSDELSLRSSREDIWLVTDGDGQLRIEHLAPGAYRAAASKNAARSDEANLTVEAGRTAEARLVLPRQ